MPLLLAFSFLAGVVTVLSPCVLPVLPVILSGAVGTGRRRPFGIVAGFLLSFTTLTLGLAALVRSLRLDPELPRLISALVIVLFALVLVVPTLKDRFAVFAARLVNAAGAGARLRAPGSRRAPSESTSLGTSTPGLGPEGPSPRMPGAGFWAGLATGFSLGAVWTPCVGPIMASVITLAVSRSLDAGAVLITLAYAGGTAIPLTAIMLGGRSLIDRVPGLTARLVLLQRGFGVLMLAAGAAILAGWDRTLQSFLLERFPAYGAGLTSLEERPEVAEALSRRAAGAYLGAATDAGSSDAGAAAPAFPDGGGRDPLALTAGPWHNSQPLTLAGLRGKVVLVDFWTYSCINCQRTIPYLAAWYRRYASDGFVIVGVHSPEFAFEGDAANVERAMAELGVTWPVVQDNDFGVWKAFSNRYWPAHYLFARDGSLADVHYGEGAYAETELLIRRLLGAETAPYASKSVPALRTTEGRNPETYLGSDRARNWSSAQGRDASGRFTLGAPPGHFEWGLEGAWIQTGEYLEAAPSGRLVLDFTAKDVYLVVSPVAGATSRIGVQVDGRPAETEDVRGGALVPTESRLYHLFAAPDSRSGRLTLSVEGPVRFFAFTFS